ncbi:hypothetical protein HAX54_009485 [Datura stramonium]|uniref:Cyclin N-terminal domain-containing protein n=1 Tax=Datura stramonium TaxID=4076 RepID=A0ABS8WXH0_DATST|nr:hypothetical protein [Datura stramonium]
MAEIDLEMLVAAETKQRRWELRKPPELKLLEVYEQQKELILSGERVVLATLAFDLNLTWEAACRLRTSLCLQFKPHHIAAGAIFLAAKFLKVKLPSDGEGLSGRVRCPTPTGGLVSCLGYVYFMKFVASEAEGSAGGNQRPAGKSSAAHEEHAANNSNSLGGGANTSAGTSNPASSSEIPDQPYADNHSGLPRTHSNNDYGSAEHNFSGNCGDGEINDRQKHDEAGGLSG